jgi:hypothetical protein
MNRLPLSRQQKSAAALCEGARPYVDHSIEGLRTKTALEVVYPSSCRSERAIYSVGKEAHTQIKPIKCWPPESVEGDCLHCGDELNEVYPIAKYKAETKYWVFGQFCSPGCCLGYAREMGLGCQIETWTRCMLHSVFGIQSTFKVCPPRFCLRKYGGGMDKEGWKAIDFAQVVEPPLATFAMFAEASAREKGGSVAQQTVRLQNLVRPATRDTPIALPTTNGREPVLLQLIAAAAPAMAEDDVPQSPSAKPKRAKKSVKTSQMLLECM